MIKFELVKCIIQNESCYTLFDIRGAELKVRIHKKSLGSRDEVYTARYTSYCTEEETCIVDGEAVTQFIYLLTGVDIQELDIYE